MEPIVSLHNVTKTFGSNVVLDDVSLDVRPGEVHGLLGHNGSGKSTLIKVLAGVVVPDSGTLTANGLALGLPIPPDEVRKRGFAFVHQGLGLADDLTVLENLAVSDFIKGRLRAISWRRHREDAAGTLERFGVAVDLDAKVRDLASVERAIVAIARALRSVEGVQGGRMLVLDEPTVYLSRARMNVLFDTVRHLAASGDGILFVSHRLDEVLELTDRVSVLRDGRLVATEATSKLVHRDLVRMIVGRDVEVKPVTKMAVRARQDAVVVRHLEGRQLRGVDLHVSKGEILGLAGAVGSGHSEVLYAIFGAGSDVSGELELDGRRLDLSKLCETEAIDLGLALIPDDRLRLAVAPEMSVVENISLIGVSQFFKAGILRLRAERDHVRELVDQFQIRLPGQEAPISQLSGGNQQKCVLAKWLSQNPRLVLLHEPTQGVDVGGHFDIWAQLRSSVAQGAAVVVASESADELADLCDRVLVFRDGAIIAELRGADVTKDTILGHLLSDVPGVAAGGVSPSCVDVTPSTD